MPNAYTEIIHNDSTVSFKSFLKNFMKISIKEESENRFRYDKKIKEQRTRLKEVHNWNKEQADKEALLSYEKAIDLWSEIVAEKAELSIRYKKVIKGAEKWDLDPEHKQFKGLVLNEIKRGFDFDCRYVPDEPKLLSGEEYKAQEIKKAIWLIEFYTKEHEEIERKTKEIAALRNSLIESLKTLS